MLSSLWIAESPRLNDTLSRARWVYGHAKSILFVYILLTQSLKAQRHLRARGLSYFIRDIYRWACQRAIFLFLRLPAARRKVELEINKAKLDIEDKLVPKGADVSRHLSLPAEGKSLQWILVEMDKMDRELAKYSGGHTAEWEDGKISGAIYHGGEELSDVITQAFRRYVLSNPLHPEVFPAIRKMEAEVVSMCLRMYNSVDGAGAMTSGGTESIIMAVKTYRDWARDTKGITEPEMIVPSSAHAAFWKAAAYLNVKLHSVPIDLISRKADLKRMKRAINGNTIMLVGSCINFPDGNQDPIPALAAVAHSYGIGMHVDCCLGSFIVPFLKAAGLAEGNEDGAFSLEEFDFSVKGVTSISCDTHKYGFAPKGTSVIMYRSAELRRYQYYVHANWSGGVYASPSIAGSRPGSLIAGAWATMHYMGSADYIESCRSIVTAARHIAQGITTIPELYVLGSPPASVVAFASRDPKALNVMEVEDRMKERGWHLNAIGSVGERGAEGIMGVHIAVTRLTVPVVDKFIADLKDAVKEARIRPSGKGTMVALYGLGNSSAVGPSMVGELAASFLDALYKA